MHEALQISRGNYVHLIDCCAHITDIASERRNIIILCGMEKEAIRKIEGKSF